MYLLIITFEIICILCIDVFYDRCNFLLCGIIFNVSFQTSLIIEPFVALCYNAKIIIIFGLCIIYRYT